MDGFVCGSATGHGWGPIWLRMSRLGADLPTRYGVRPRFGFSREMVNEVVDGKRFRINKMRSLLPRKYGSNSAKAGVFTVPDWQP